MDSSGFSSPRSDCFPAGLRVLVVDDDPTWLKILEKMLKKCNYEVTTCNLAREALDLLRERKEGFDIVISDVNMPDMDGFKLLEHVGLEMDLPVIMMSVDGETSRVMKGVQHGACDYLLKPIRMKELRNIWQHVFRKRIHEVRDIEGQESFEPFDENYLFSGDLISGKKRKDADTKHEDRMCGDPSSVKKARVVWTVDLHQKFVKAVNQIGFDKVGPKKILDLMGVPWLTRENVASHLQKYRLYLSRLQKENELKAAFGGIKRPDFSPKDPNGNARLQNSINHSAVTCQQKTATSESYGDKVLVHTEGNMKGLVQMQTLESKNAIFGDVIDPPNSVASSINFSHSFSQLESEIKTKPKIQDQYSWSSNAPLIQFKQEHEPLFESKHRFDHQLPLPTHHIQVDPGEHILSSIPLSEGMKHKKSSYEKCQSQGTVEANEIDSTLFSVQPQRQLTAFEPIQHSMWSTKSSRSIDQNLPDDLESCQKSVVLGPGSALWLWDDAFNGCSSQGDVFHAPNAYSGNMQPFGYNNQEVIADIPSRLYDSLSFDFQCPSDPVEYSVIDQSLYIA